MELELKHIAPYLNYGLKGFILLRHYDIVHTVDFENSIISGLNHGSCRIEDFMPVLRPLDEFIKKENEHFHDAENRFGEHGFSLKYGIHREGIRFSFTNGMVSVGVPFAFWEYLLKHHYDIFSLIPKGLAIDINIIKTAKK